jgi:transcriptional regulator with XRE-family HTH domain
MPNSPLSPAELRAMFGANLRKLAEPYQSISELSRALGINRTQFNRYLSGESFPRPDVLARVCAFFKVDARVLLEPVDKIARYDDPIANPFLQDYVGVGSNDVPTDIFPSGFFRFSRRSFLCKDVFILGVVHIRRDGRNTFIRGFESINSMRVQSLTTDKDSREFRGIVIRQDDGVAIIASRLNAMTCSYNYLNKVASFQNNFWLGYVTRTIPERANDMRITRLVYEYLGPDPKDALPAARAARFYTVDELPPFHHRLLMPDAPFF